MYPENVRLFELIDELMSRGEISSYVELALKLNTNKSGINDLKNSRKKVSLELLRDMKISYPELDIVYVIMGGKRNSQEQQQAITEETSNIPPGSYLDIIQSQAKEIGILTERVRNLEERNIELERMAKKAQAYVDSVSSMGSTNVG